MYPRTYQKEVQMSPNNSEEELRAGWEFLNNPSMVTVLDPDLGCEMGVDVLILIEPDAYAHQNENRKLRRLGIEQGKFTPSPESEEERLRLDRSNLYGEI